MQDTLLFDLDGTLTDSRSGILACIRHALVAMDVAPPADDVLADCLGPPLRGSFARLLASDVPARIDRAMAHYRERFDAVGWRENAVYPGVMEALASLRAHGHRMFVCTSKPAVYARRIVAHFALDSHFDGVYGPGLDGSLDDKRHLLAHIVAREGLDAARAQMVGDRHHDVAAARANNVRAVGVLWGYGSPAELSGADGLATHPGDLARAVVR
jgi:phosphoglycolate phosphatase